ncbi:hypothetical protein IE4872_CH02149 [Rhizobium gallicum]|uniref:Uncharacterized protein n=1 Tax=Rhizobium gallicum TaxID=56730 RepID=A0A1L5NIS8_9HYPH|nr:hypothetical protein IE4872_CH02149 [Rhizobium gallicum]
MSKDGATKICSAATFPLAKSLLRRIIAATLLGESGLQTAGAEGATAPETLRPKDQQGADGTLERSVLETLAEGITISGTGTEGARKQGVAAPSD